LNKIKEQLDIVKERILDCKETAKPGLEIEYLVIFSTMLNALYKINAEIEKLKRNNLF